MTPEREAVDTLEWGKRLPEYVLFYLELFWKIHEQKRQSSSRAGILLKVEEERDGRWGEVALQKSRILRWGRLALESLLPLVDTNRVAA
jgi:hypothetical protein